MLDNFFTHHHAPNDRIQVTSFHIEDLKMRKHIRTLCIGLSAAGLLALTGSVSQAQITHAIKADIQHDFRIGDTVLPPGTYVFRVLDDSDEQAMNVKSVNNDLSEDFLVRQSDDKKVPDHAELIFDRYGNEEFLI
jgi:hypothetical protein